MSSQRNEMRGGLRAEGFRFGVVVSRFNSFITERLLDAALDTLGAAGAADADVEIVRVPRAFCVLTCDTLEQAIERAGLKGGNKGADAALAAIEMAGLGRKLASNAAPAHKTAAAAASGRKSARGARRGTRSTR